MRRRDVLTFLGALAAFAHATPVQSQRSRPLIVYQFGAATASVLINLEVFRKGLAELGFIDGQTVDLMTLEGEGDPTRARAVAAEIARLRPNLIVCSSNSGIRAAQRAAPATPIISPILSDPIGNGFVASFEKPGGNISGVLLTQLGAAGKVAELAHDVFPRATDLGLLGNADNPSTSQPQKEDSLNAAELLGIRMVPIDVRNRSEIDRAFPAFKREGVTAVIVVADAVFFEERAAIAARALAAQLPTLYAGPREHVLDGGMISLSIEMQDNWRLAGRMAAQILKGARPAALPVVFPSKLVLTINQKTAKTLGVTIPKSVLARANEIIQ